VGSPDYAAALDVVPDASEGDFSALLLAAAEPLCGGKIDVFLADFAGRVLQLLVHGPEGSDTDLVEEEVSSSMAGRVYRSGEPLTADRDGEVRVWVPLLDGGERMGVVALTVPEATDDVLADCVRLGRFAGLLARSFARSTDLIHCGRRRRPMTLAAGMQWDLLPPTAVRSPEALACGRLEPAYEIAGDAFDYVMNDGRLHAAIFDGMGHGMESTLMTTLAVGAYRHSRRMDQPLDEMFEVIDQALAEHYKGDAFVTGALARLEVASGTLEWTDAGHPVPLLLRAHRVVRELSCAPSLPMGLGGPCREVATESLEPGDCVLFFTDGMVEGRSESGEEYGVERLIDDWEQQSASDAQPDEVLRRLVESVTSYVGNLRDDASLLLISWSGSAEP